MGILRRASRLRRRGTTGSIGMGDGLSPKSGWFCHAFPELSPRLPQGLPRLAPSVFGVPKKQKFRQAGQSPSRATFVKKTKKIRKGCPCGWIRCSRIGGRRPKPRGRIPGRAPSGWGRALGEAADWAQRMRRGRAPSGPCASIEPGGGAPRGPIPEPLRSGGRRGPRPPRRAAGWSDDRNAMGCPNPAAIPRFVLWCVGSRRRYRASLSSKGAKTPSLRMQVWPWDSNRGRSRLLTASISW